VIFALVLCGSMYLASVFAVAAPAALLFLGAMWMHHDRRVGSNARYLRDVLEPAMHDCDGIEGFEAYLDRTEPNRSHTMPSFTSAMSRLLFPVLQVAMVGLGMGRYIAARHHDDGATTLMVVGVVLGIALAVFTFAKVKHQRLRPVAPTAS
jgi:hypothetical protein